MIEHISDPIFAAIEQHRVADAALDDSFDRRADESVKDERLTSEGLAMVALLRTKPETVAGCLAVVRYLADWAENNDAGLFHGWVGPRRWAAAEFLPMIADTIEGAFREMAR
jgi:hypothetical protein